MSLMASSWYNFGLLPCESGRTAHERLGEHVLKLYPDKTMAQHYNIYHQDISADHEFKVLYVLNEILNAARQNRKKILETYHIYKIKPEINNKEECESVKRFLVV